MVREWVVMYVDVGGSLDWCLLSGGGRHGVDRRWRGSPALRHSPSSSLLDSDTILSSSRSCAHYLPPAIEHIDSMQSLVRMQAGSSVQETCIRSFIRNTRTRKIGDLRSRVISSYTGSALPTPIQPVRCTARMPHLINKSEHISLHKFIKLHRMHHLPTSNPFPGAIPDARKQREPGTRDKEVHWVIDDQVTADRARSR